MTPEELELARSLLASVQNTTVQGWDILVRGMVISRAIDLVIGLISIILPGYVGFLMWKEQIKQDCNDKVALVLAVGIGTMVAMVLLAIMLELAVGLPALGLLCPEYSVLEKLIGGCQ